MKRSEIERILKLPKGRIRFYLDQGILSYKKETIGRGNSREYSEKDLFVIAIIIELTKLGLTLTRIKQFIGYLVTNYNNVITIENYNNNEFNPFGFISKDNFIVAYTSNYFLELNVITDTFVFVSFKNIAYKLSTLKEL